MYYTSMAEIRNITDDEFQELGGLDAGKKWKADAQKIVNQLKEGQEIVGYHIESTEETERRDYSVNGPASSLLLAIRGLKDFGEKVYSVTRYSTGEGELKKGWWILISTKEFKKLK